MSKLLTVRRVIILTTIVPNPLIDIPIINALIYLGGSIPANPERAINDMLIVKLKMIIIKIVMDHAVDSLKNYTKRGRKNMNMAVAKKL